MQLQVETRPDVNGIVPPQTVQLQIHAILIAACYTATSTADIHPALGPRPVPREAADRPLGLLAGNETSAQKYSRILGRIQTYAQVRIRGQGQGLGRTADFPLLGSKERRSPESAYKHLASAAALRDPRRMSVYARE